MATCRDIVTLGLKQVGVVALGDDPTAEELDTGLDVLQSLYRGWFSAGEFGLFEEVYRAADYTAKEQDRVTAEAGVTVTLPTTFDANGDEYGDPAGQRRAPRELAAIEVIQDGAIQSYIWERTAWVDVNALTENSAAPLSHYGKAGLAACLAMHYAETFGAQLGPGTKRLADLFKVAFRSRRVSANPRLQAEFS